MFVGIPQLKNPEAHSLLGDKVPRATFFGGRRRGHFLRGGGRERRRGTFFSVGGGGVAFPTSEPAVEQPLSYCLSYFPGAGIVCW